jgi:hypothetical protein
MTLRVTLLRHLPGGIYRRRLLDELAQTTAAAFGTGAPDWRGSPYADRLAAYAEYTNAAAERLATPTVPVTDALIADVAKERLYRDAVDLGAKLRRRLGIRGPKDALLVLGLLYRQIGIEVSGQATGGGTAAERADLHVSRCFFADHYAQPTCRLMGALDAGVVDGLFGGASLEFSQRITDGSPCCRAVIRTTKAQP